MLHNTN